MALYGCSYVTHKLNTRFNPTSLVPPCFCSVCHYFVQNWMSQKEAEQILCSSFGFGTIQNSTRMFDVVLTFVIRKGRFNVFWSLLSSWPVGLCTLRFFRRTPPVATTQKQLQCEASGFQHDFQQKLNLDSADRCRRQLRLSHALVKRVSESETAVPATTTS